MIKMLRAFRKNGRGRSSFKILIDILTRNYLLKMPRHRWQGNIRIDLIEIRVNVKNVIVWSQGLDS